MTNTEATAGAGRSDGSQPGLSLQSEVGAIATIIGRHLWLIAFSIMAGVALATLYCQTATPMYRATAQITLDPRRVQMAQPMDMQTLRRDQPLIDDGRADSEAQVLQSESVIRKVVTTLGLQDNPVYAAKPSLMTTIKTSLGFPVAPTAPLTEDDKVLDTMVAVANGLKITRVDKSYAFTIEFAAKEPNLAAQVANAFVSIYIRDQLDASYDTSQQSSGWLKGQLDQLAKDAQTAEQDVVEFRKQNNIAVADGKSIADQQLSAISDQLSQAVADRAAASAKLDQIRQAEASNSPDFASSDALTNEVIVKLRQQYVANANNEADLSRRFGPDHSAVLRLKDENEVLAKSINNELKRYEQTYESDFQIASAKEEALKAELQSQFSKTMSLNADQVKLDQLESRAKTLRTAYETQLQRFTEAQGTRSFPVSEARVISSAIPPTSPASPKRIVVTAAGTVAGLLLGLGLAFGFEITNRLVRTKADAEAVSGVPCVGYVPRAKTSLMRMSNMPRTSRFRLFRQKGLAPDEVAQRPLSITAETLRAAKIAVDDAVQPQQGLGRVVGFVSALPNEGKTSLSANFAFLLAQGRRKILLIDGDRRNPGLSRILAADDEFAKGGAVDGANRRQGRYALSPQLDFLPELAVPQKIGQAVGLDSVDMQRLIDDARRNYDYVVIDLPPLLMVVDARTIAPMVDAFIMVIDAEHTSGKNVNDALAMATQVWSRLAGTILNKVNLRSLKRYGEHVDSYYNSNYFQQ